MRHSVTPLGKGKWSVHLKRTRPGEKSEQLCTGATREEAKKAIDSYRQREILAKAAGERA